MLNDLGKSIPSSNVPFISAGLKQKKFLVWLKKSEFGDGIIA